MFFGPTPVPEGIRRCDEIRDEVSGNLGAEAWTLRSLAGLHAMDGRFELARELLADSNAIFEELGQTRNSSVSHVDGIVEMLAGDPAAAERHLLEGYRALEEMGDKAFLSTTAAYLAQAVYAQGRRRRGQAATQRSARSSPPVTTCSPRSIWRSVRAGFLARQGRLDEAEDARAGGGDDWPSRRTSSRPGPTPWQSWPRSFSKAVASRRRRSAAAEGLALYEQKGNTVAAGKIRTDLAVLLHV